MSPNSCCVVIYIFLSIILQNCVRSQQEILIEESSQMESVVAPTLGVAELPCDVTPALPDDRVGLVIWYKQGHDSPIYTLDTREGVLQHWSDHTTLGARATFRSDSQPAVLVLSKLRPEDSGQYRCRVDFIRSPTKNTRLNLTVLIPPERLIILNNEGNEIHNGVVGPYDDGAEISLTCVAVGGRPTARLSWWKSHALLANSEGRAAVSFRVGRSDLGTNITCQAVTDPMIPPMSETLTIDVNLRPLWARLQGDRRPLVAGQSTELVCQVIGARPNPSISWWKGGTRLKTVRETTSETGNVTSSILTFVPSMDDAGRVLSCRAVQPAMTHSTQEDGFTMEVQHIPVVTLELGANLDASHVVEGTDVYLDCRVRANPSHHHVYFTHNGVVVKPGAKVLLANQSLVLQGVSRQAAGLYVCAARNSLGEGPSDEFNLDVKFPPTCQSPAPAVVRAARGETFEIECHLDANPKETMSYHWRFNSSAQTKHELFTTSGNTASNMAGVFVYTVNSSVDYGWMQCSGSNSVGRQVKPCLYHILPADKPSPLKSCEISNVTYDSITLSCIPGHDGGIRQSFLLQMYDSSSGQLLKNISNDDPEFEVSGLTANSPLSILVQAFNKKGASEPLKLTSHLLKYPQRHTGQVRVKVELTTVLMMVVLGAVGTIMVMTAAWGAVVCCKRCGRRGDKKEKYKRQQQDTSSILITETKETISIDNPDKNPDIIPLDSTIRDDCSNKSSNTDYSSIRPLISKSSADKYDSIPSNCEDYLPYYQIRPLDNQEQSSDILSTMLNICPSIQVLGPIANATHMSNISADGCYISRPPCERGYEDWLKYKNALPLHTSGPLPHEHIIPPKLYATPPPPRALYHQIKNPRVLAPMFELDCRPVHIEPRSLSHTISQDQSRSCSSSPPVRFSPDTNSAYFSNTMSDRSTNTLPHVLGHRDVAPPATHLSPPALHTATTSSVTNTGVPTSYQGCT